MGNALEYILRLQDTLSPALRAAASISESAGFKIANSINHVTASASSMGSTNVTGAAAALSSSVNEVAGSLRNVGETNVGNKIARQFEAPIANVNQLNGKLRETEMLAKEGGKGSSGGGGFGLGLGGILGSMGGIGLGYGAFEMFKNALSASAQRESNQVNLGVMTGSPQVGNKLLKDMTAMADTTPFESKDLIQSGQLLLQFGMTADKVMPSLRQLGDISGGNAEKLQQLTLAFGKVTSEGKLSGRELEEMIYAGFNPLTVIADKTGMKMADLRKAMEHGAIGADMVQKAMDVATGAGGRFHDLMLKNSETLGGKWSTFMDGVHHRLRDLGDSFRPVAMIAMDVGKNLMEIANQAMPFVNNAISSIVNLFTGINSGSSAWSGYFNIIKGVAASLWETTKGIAKTVFGIVWSFTEWVKKSELMKDIFWVIEKVGVTVYKAIGGIVDLIGWLWKNIAMPLLNSIEWVYSGIKSILGLAGKVEVKGTTTVKMPVVKAPDVPVAPPITGNDFNGLKTYGEGTGKEKADKINNGGQRSIVINVGKQIEKLEMHIVGGSKEVAEDLHNAVADAMRRVLYSVNGAVTN